MRSVARGGQAPSPEDASTPIANLWTGLDQATDHDDVHIERKPRLLLLCDYRPNEATTVIDHIEAIRSRSRAMVYVLPIFGDIPDELDLEAFDGLLIHYNLVITSNQYLSPLARWRVRNYTGIKAAFIQDEYRFVDDTVSVMRALGVEVLFSCVPSEEVEKVYPRALLPSLRKVVNVLTGYVPDSLVSADVVPYEQRTIDVGYRGRRLPAWLGELAQEKTLIADRFKADATAYGLATDISCDESDRLYGDAWISFISSCKSMLGVESGASVFDFDGSIEAAVRDHLARHPGTPFNDLQTMYFAEAEGRIRLNQISPRSFEAAALGTLMILYPGDYSGILKPWRHYVPLEKDHSNMPQVVEALRNRALVNEITGHAKDEVALNSLYSYQAMVDTVDDAMDLRSASRPEPDLELFVRLASGSFASMPHTRLRALGAPTLFNRVRLALAQASHPNAVAAAPSIAYDGERLRLLRRLIRLGQALVYWAVRPDILPRRHLFLGGRRLLEELAELRRLQILGRRARLTTGSSPFLLIADHDAEAVRIVTSVDRGSANLVGRIPSDLDWARSINLDFGDRWLVPIDQASRRRMTLKALSAVLKRAPDVARELIAGDEPWCGVALTDGRPRHASA